MVWRTEDGKIPVAGGERFTRVFPQGRPSHLIGSLFLVPYSQQLRRHFFRDRRLRGGGQRPRTRTGSVAVGAYISHAIDAAAVERRVAADARYRYGRR